MPAKIRYYTQDAESAKAIVQSVFPQLWQRLGESIVFIGPFQIEETVLQHIDSNKGISVVDYEEVCRREFKMICHVMFGEGESFSYTMIAKRDIFAPSNYAFILELFQHHQKGLLCYESKV